MKTLTRIMSLVFSALILLSVMAPAASAHDVGTAPAASQEVVEGGGYDPDPDRDGTTAEQYDTVWHYECSWRYCTCSSFHLGNYYNTYYGYWTYGWHCRVMSPYQPSRVY